MERRYDIQGVEAIDEKVLDTIEYEYPGKRIEVEIAYPEFTSVCPFSGLPDFAEIIIKYVPNKKCIELKSLKYYLHSYRNVGIYQEHVVNRIMEDLVQLCDPLEMTIVGKFNIRGGMGTVIRREYKKEG